jgi:hypothetical protein
VTESKSDKPSIKIAHRSVHGLEHYDGVKQVVLSSQNQHTPNKSRSRKLQENKQLSFRPKEDQKEEKGRQAKPIGSEM